MRWTWVLLLTRALGVPRSSGDDQPGVGHSGHFPSVPSEVQYAALYKLALEYTREFEELKQRHEDSTERLADAMRHMVFPPVPADTHARSSEGLETAGSVAGSADAAGEATPFLAAGGHHSSQYDLVAAGRACAGSPVEQMTVGNLETCAARCEGHQGCRFFSYWGECNIGRCKLYGSCDETKVPTADCADTYRSARGRD